MARALGRNGALAALLHDDAYPLAVKAKYLTRTNWRGPRRTGHPLNYCAHLSD